MTANTADCRANSWKDSQDKVFFNSVFLDEKMLQTQRTVKAFLALFWETTNRIVLGSFFSAFTYKYKLPLYQVR